MPKVRIFMDSSALMAGIISPSGAARALLLLAEDEKIALYISQQVIVEVERNLAKKVPKLLPLARLLIKASEISIVQDPSPDEVANNTHLIRHAADVPILLAAKAAKVDFLVTLNTRHFLDSPSVAQLSGLNIGTPGDAIHWWRENL